MNYFYYDEEIEYPRELPYNPEVMYPEYPYPSEVSEGMDNKIYASIRDMFINLGLDKENVGKKNWNPLSKYVTPGQTVLIKPNLVNHKNPGERDHIRGMDCLITHPSLVRCIFDYVFIALQGLGRIIIADAPIQDCDFDILLSGTGYGELFSF